MKDGATERRWWMLSVAAPPRGEEHLLIDALRRVGARAVERRGDRFRALFPAPADTAGLTRRALLAIRSSTNIEDPDPRASWLEHARWAEEWRQQTPSVRVGRVVVVPEGRVAEVGADDLVVRLVPGPAFGTAEHPTTRACLDILQRFLRPGDRVLDLGAGTAILAITAVKAGAASALAVEADRLACHDGEANARLNGVADRVEVVQREVRADDLGAAGPFDLVLANLEGPVLLPLIPTLVRALEPGGSAIVGGLVRTERAALLEHAAGPGLHLVEERRDGGWWSGVLHLPA